MSLLASRPVLAAVLFGLAAMQNGCFGPSTREDGPLPFTPPIAARLDPVGAPAGWKVEVGPGHDSWVAVPEDAEVERVHGAQGGYHVATSARVTQGVEDLRSVEVEVEVATAVTGAVISRSLSMMPAAPSDGALLLENLYAFLDKDTSGPIVVRVTVAEMVSDRTKPRRWAAGEKRVVVH